MADYKPHAREQAEARGLSADDVRAMDHHAIAELAGTAFDDEGRSPVDFFWQNVRRHVADWLDRKAEDDAAEALRAKLELRLRGAPEFPDATVEQNADGDLVIRLGEGA